MKNVLIIGAGRSTSSLIKYICENAESEGWKIKVVDQDLKSAEKAIDYYEEVASAEHFDANNEFQMELFVREADYVISMLPAHMHVPVAKACLNHCKHLLTASYISDEMKELSNDAKSSGVIFLNEIGVDPGIDHMSAMKVIHDIKEEGGVMRDFESFTGGLVAPESDNNPWNYKFTWNPRNVVLAGQGGAVKFIQEGQYKFIPYHRLFRRTEIISIDGYGKFEGYANRDSLKYRSVYGLDDVKTMFRGTLRRPGFCKAWNLFVQLGVTDDSYILPNTEEMTHREFINTFLAYNPNDSVEIKLRQYLKIDQDDVDLWEKLEWLGLFERTKIGLKEASPAQVLQHILEKKWKLEQRDKDMIVMWHKFVYEKDGERKERHSSMVCIGEERPYTAMAKTVGLPLGIALKLVHRGEIKTPGVHLPITPEIYLPILRELEAHGIKFEEKQVN